MSATLKEISEITGVSISTVSRALKNDPRISESTKMKVLNTAREIGYSIDDTGKTDKVIMFFVSNPHESIESDEFFSRVQTGVLEGATRNYYHCLVQSMPLSKNFENTTIPLNLIQGLIVGGIPMPDGMKDFLLNLNIPVVLIGKYSRLEHFPSVNNDNIRGGYLAASEILKRDYSKIFIITGPGSVPTFYDRTEGFFKCLRESGYSTAMVEVIEKDTFDEKAGKSAAIEIAPKLGKGESAIFCTTDWLAKGVLEGLNSLQMNVPDQVGLLGFGGLSFCKHISPKLSTIALNPYLLGKISFMMLQEQLENSTEANGAVFIEPSFTNGETLIRRRD